jgi:hypothetical protein
LVLGSWFLVLGFWLLALGLWLLAFSSYRVNPPIVLIDGARESAKPKEQMETGKTMNRGFTRMIADENQSKFRS